MRGIALSLLALLVAAAPVAGQAPAPAPGAAAAPSAPVFKNEELEQLVAPIALYPDALVAQILMASTYPLEVVAAARWVKANPGLKDKALEDALQKQSWDPSVKSLTAFPQVLQTMNEKLEMTQKLGDAFLAQQKDVLDAIQRLRGKADQAGNLKSGKEQTVTKTQEGGTTVIKIEPTSPQTVYVPTYNPAVVYGTWPYPAYPPYYYPYPPGAGLFAFTAGVIVGSALWGGCNWGHGDVNINVNKYNNFNKTNIQNGNWSHNAEHRKGVGYRDQGSQQKFGGQQRASVDSREQFRGRAEQGRQEISRGGADDFKGRGGDRPSAGTSDRGGRGDRGGGPSAGTSDRGGLGGGDRGGASASTRGGSQAGAFQGMDRGGGDARAQSNRGASSRQSMGGGAGGGGARAGGGGRGGRR
jgi:hypothetical protein